MKYSALCCAFVFLLVSYVDKGSSNNLSLTESDNQLQLQFKIGKDESLPSAFVKASDLRDSLDNTPGIIISNMQLAEYYEEKEPAIVLKYANEAVQLARTSKNLHGLLESLRVKSWVNKPNSYEDREHITVLNDSLQKEKREAKNQFARLRFENDEITANNEYLKTQRNWMILGSFFILVSVVFGFIFRHQTIKDKQLQLKQQQLKSNEEIFNLLMDQHNKQEEGRQKEKKRIAAELHDGVLGKIFGIRLILSSLNQNTDKESLEIRENYIAELKRVGEEIRTISHDLDYDNFESQSGFLGMIEELIAEQSLLGNFKATLNSDRNIDWQQVSNTIKLNLYRVLQESMYNITKYAEAQEVFVIITSKSNKLFLMLKDDGQGFDASATINGIGLKNIQERVKNLNGTFNLNSDRKGTVIKIKIPLNLNEDIWLSA